MATVRPLRPDDREGVAAVAYATAFFGRSARRFFANERLFAELWVAPYFGGAGCCGFVAEANGRVVGYVLGSCDPARYRRFFLNRGPGLVARALTGGYGALGNSAFYLVRTLRYPSKHAAPRDFPAHLHLNLLAEARGQGLGRALLEHQLSCLSAAGVAGVQLSTTAENEAAVALYAKLGFTPAHRYRSELWQPWLGREVEHLVLTRRFRHPFSGQHAEPSSTPASG